MQGTTDSTSVAPKTVHRPGGKKLQGSEYGLNMLNEEFLSHALTKCLEHGRNELSAGDCL